MWAGAGTIISTATGFFLKLPAADVDLTPWIHWRLPDLPNQGLPNQDPSAVDAGPILVTIEYDVDPIHALAFVKAVSRYGRVRRRDGAYSWGIFRDFENPDRYVETFLVDSWAEHLRQHERSTRADQEVEERVQSYARGKPTVRHLVYATASGLHQRGS